MHSFYRCVAVLVLSTLCSCGYTFQGGGSVLPPDIKQVYVPPVDNLTTDSSLTTLVTEALQDRFERFGVLQVVDEPQLADAILRARVLRLTRDTRAVTSATDTARTLDARLVMAAELRRPNGMVLWRNPNIQVVSSFASTADTVVTTSPDFFGGGLAAPEIGGLETRELARDQEQEAVNQLVEEAARRIYQDAVAPDF